MNSDPNLLKRLIRLYPVKLLKDEFGATGVSDSLYDEIIRNNNAAIIRTFAYNPKNHYCISQFLFIFCTWEKYIRPHK
jgi:hypothetical protein